MSATITSAPVKSVNKVPVLELDETLEKLRQLFLHHTRISAETNKAMRQLMQRCVNRFATEENSAWYSGIADRAPWLHSQVEHLTGQHHELRERLADLCETAEHQLALADTWETFSATFADFQLDLAAHEEAERETCYQAYILEVGTKD